ncbi:cytochrome oxidase complex assembly protein 1 [Roseimicrobium gellanilyticum]|uniref:Cytochrome oxidase complex assembly protein 1 n=1 Tax=Roseimicrobium gellanilyticum TaxID=748857 RepID=A0A366HGZ5_9BACT|nr:cytochrome c oxidase assembly factor Coa1 family protein [Roseimicrobium gellanilyticum]RBP41206.1 cytochrome oxidase complex assembly protein 1 [Roseimicrobium gellanilyticum]
MNPYPPSQPPVPQKSSKKWWFLGCGGCLGIIALGVLAIGFFVVSIMGVIKKTDAYTGALQRAQSSAELQEAIGTPMEPSYWVMGAVSTNNGAESAEFAIPLTGPKGVAAVTVKASRPAGATAWEYSILEALVASGPKKDTKIELK